MGSSADMRSPRQPPAETCAPTAVSACPPRDVGGGKDGPTPARAHPRTVRSRNHNEVTLIKVVLGAPHSGGGTTSKDAGGSPKEPPPPCHPSRTHACGEARGAGKGGMGALVVKSSGCQPLGAPGTSGVSARGPNAVCTRRRQPPGGWWWPSLGVKRSTCSPRPVALRCARGGGASGTGLMAQRRAQGQGPPRWEPTGARGTQGRRREGGTVQELCTRTRA